LIGATVLNDLNSIQMDMEFLEIPVIFHAILVKIFTFEQEK